MPKDTVKQHPLSYAGPQTKTTAGPYGQIVLIVVNVLAAVASLWFVPLAWHIYSCSSDQKWCHFQALLLGVPAAVVVCILGVYAVCTTMDVGRCTRARTLAIWLPLAVPTIVLVALAAAIIHNT